MRVCRLSVCATVLGLAIAGRPRLAHVLEVIGGLVTLGGAAITGVQSGAVATLAGVVTAVGFVALGMLPGRVLMSVAGSLGLLVFVPWSISHFFPFSRSCSMLARSSLCFLAARGRIASAIFSLNQLL